MKPRFPKRAVRIASVLCGLWGIVFITGAAETELSRAEILRIKRDRIVLPRLEFREASLSEALNFLAKKAAELDTTEPDGEETRTPRLVYDTPVPDGDLITLSLSNVSLGEAFRHTAALAKLSATISADGSRIELTKMTRRFGDLVDHPDLSKAQRALIARAKEIIIPRLQFKEAGVTQAADFCRAKARELDRSPLTPARGGLNVVVRPSGAMSGSRVTLILEGKSLFDALEEIAKQAGAELLVTDSALILDGAK